MPSRYENRTSSATTCSSAGCSPVAWRSLGHVGHADDPGEGRGADLDLVEPADQLVDRRHELHGVQRDGGDGADAGDTRAHQVGAPREHDDDRQEERDVGAREEPRPQPQRVPLRVAALPQRGVDLAALRGCEAERLDGAHAIHRLADGAAEGGVGGELALVARARPLQVPPGGDDEDGDAREHRDGHRRVDQERGDDGQNGGDAGHEDARHAEPDGLGDRLDVVGAAREQVTRPGRLDRGEREAGDGREELLPQLGEDALAEHHRLALREPDQDRLAHDRAEQHEGDRVDAARVERVSGDAADDQADEGRTGEAGDGGEGVQHEHDREAPAVLADEPGAGRPDGRGASDRKQHRLFPSCAWSSTASWCSSSSSLLPVPSECGRWAETGCVAVHSASMDPVQAASSCSPSAGSAALIVRETMAR